MGRKKKAVGPLRVGLACLAPEASLLRCIAVAGDGSRRLVVLWIRREEWVQLIRTVVVPCFLGSRHLLSLTHPAIADGGLESVTAENCWLQWPCTVKPSTHSKRERDIKTGCVLPAPKSRIVESFKKAAELAAPADRPADRRPSYAQNDDGYAYLEFDVWGVLAMEEVAGKWQDIDPPQTRAGQVWCAMHALRLMRTARPPAPCCGFVVLSVWRPPLWCLGECRWIGDGVRTWGCTFWWHT